ncbi:MAG: signal recognition particle protein [Myxococcota bacterium]|nr:signal recognition particle protein [Myxococcota bacterium]
MFEALSKGFRAAKNRLAGLTELTEENIDQALRDVRLSLLEADVELGVVKRFLETVKQRAIGQIVQTRAETRSGRKFRIGPAEKFIKICQDELEATMRHDGPALVVARKPRATGVMVVGLQGSGKTTTAAKLARWCERDKRMKPLLVAADVQRPGAIEQLRVLGERIGVPVFAIPGGRPVDICEQAREHARKLKRDVIIYDTAGRLAIDEPLMQELAEIKARVQPENVLLVVDAMIGQDAVRTARAFHERLGLTGVVLTKLDGDARGGAALSIREVTGAPVRFVGTGEGLDRLETFRPDGMASRILGFGDIVGLMREFEQVVDADKAEQDARRMLEGRFTLEDFLTQIETLQKMGPLKDIFEKLPFAGELPQGFQLDERELIKTKSIVSSMTRAERRDVELFRTQPGRIRRVARGSGRSEKDVVDLLNRFLFMRRMMGDIGQQAGLLGKLPGMKQLAMARRLREAVRTTGLEHNPLMAGLAEQLLEAAVADDGRPTSARALPAARRLERDRKKHLRKLQKKARRKNR